MRRFPPVHGDRLVSGGSGQVAYNKGRETSADRKPVVKILLVSSEVVPFAKTGGLADVCNALPAALQKLGHEVVVCLPGYRATRLAGQPIEATGVELPVSLNGQPVRGRWTTTVLPDSGVPVWLVEQEDLFGRDGLYQDENGDFADNCRRFSFFCRFVLELLAHQSWYPDILHCNDWQTGLIPAHLATRLADVDGYRHITTLMTIHNLAYQGNFPADQFCWTGMDTRFFNWRQMEFHEHLNLLKTGIVFADLVSTVSPAYAREIQTEPFGCGLQNVLQERQDRLFGVLNGIDTDAWNPQTDAALHRNYGVDDWQEGKAACKQWLQEQAGLTPDPDVPVIGLVGRLAAQKGWSLIMPVMQRWLAEHPVQWIVLGKGEPEIEQGLDRLQQAHPGRLVVHIGFSDSLARQIEAASDIFLMPSRYEPCGLNQQYSMRYGAVPVVHRTGGLADTVVDADPHNLDQQTANGFVFDNFEAEQLNTAVRRAVLTWLHDRQRWQQLVNTGMQTDWSWQRSANQYVRLYQRAKQQARASGPGPDDQHSGDPTARPLE